MSLITDILTFLGLLEPDVADDQGLPRVLVKIVDSIALNLDQAAVLSLGQLAAKAGPLGVGAAFEAVQSVASDVVFGRAFDSLSPAELDALVAAAAAQDPTYVPFNFNNALEIICDAGFDTAELETALSNWAGVVEYAYTGAEASDPVIAGTPNPLFRFQKYLGPAPDGIDAQSAWAKGADGTGTNIIDMEQGWFLSHVDLPAGIPLLLGINTEKSFSHGAAVLGILAAKDDKFGIVGVAPNTQIKVISYYDPNAKPKTNPVKRVEDRITKSGDLLSLGDVLLLESQFQIYDVQKNGQVPGATATNLPVEFEPFVFEAIRVATGKGVIVIEAAGNGGKYLNPVTKKFEQRGTDLDTFVNKAGKKALSRSTPADFKNSGAIMVTGSVSAAPHGRHKFLNFGSRIDCYAWGEDIVTCTYDPKLPTADPKAPKARDLYWGIGIEFKTVDEDPLRGFFGGTSGACPIIAGSCLLMQHLQALLSPKGRPPGKIKCEDMQTILTKPSNGTASSAATDRIGIMPDFAKIIANEFLP
jgi:hypothetical protein